MKSSAKVEFGRKELCGLLETSESFDFSPFVGRIPEFEIQITRGQRSAFLANLQKGKKVEKKIL